MNYLTNDKLVILGAGGMIGANMMQSALTMGLTPNICGYDPYEPGLQGAAEEIYHSSFSGARVTWTTDIAEALTGADYIISSGGAPRKEGMTREDLLQGNCEIAAQLGKDIRSYCPNVKLMVIIFNPADITGLVALIHSGLAPNRLATLAALDSTRLQTALSQHFQVPQDEVTGCRTYGGHGEQMAVFSSGVKIQGQPLDNLIGTDALSNEQWDAIRQHVIQGGKRIIQLRGRSSFQSPAHVSVSIIKSAAGGEHFPWPCGGYIHNEQFQHILMALETTISTEGIHVQVPTGTASELAELQESYTHLCKLRDEVIEIGIIPSVAEWQRLNPNL